MASLIGGGSVINGAYPVYFFYMFLIKNALTPNIYLSRLVVVRFWSLKKQIEENLISETLEYARSATNGKLWRPPKFATSGLFQSL
jgi:hypothetical protein